ncbi:hypothetical protein VE01_06332 [Pseudogymnoascus verrucosus]|uniref:Uncharacterized protein n=1 Tax=Pseudogymnoascus verrucosus TaxID=342668 RepID=A0A1B8GGB0_9PEZI|nr:uncharacterized protein VE01_06332 [Pseudogymnoascus verrucosus]OBT94861.1 hypothetical protein VE01_06332 [Pseudogymnoascus verrucosus]
MDSIDPATPLTDAECEILREIYQEIYQDEDVTITRSTRRRRSPSPETDRPRRNLRPRLTRPSYIAPDPEEDDLYSNSSEDVPLTTTQPNQNTINQPTITSGTASPDVGPLPVSQTDGNVTIEPPTPSDTAPPIEPASPSGTSPMTSQIKTAAEEPDIDSEAEEERMILSAKAKVASLEQTYAKNRRVRERAAVFATKMSDIKDLQDALKGELVDLKMESDEVLQEVLERLNDPIVELKTSMAELFEPLEKREIKGSIDKKLQRRTKVPDGESEMKPVERNDRESDGASVSMSDKDNGEVDKTSIAEDDKSEDEDGDKSETMSDTKDDENDGSNDEDSEFTEGDRSVHSDFTFGDSDDNASDDGDGYKMYRRNKKISVSEDDGDDGEDYERKVDDFDLEDDFRGPHSDYEDHEDSDGDEGYQKYGDRSKKTSAFENDEDDDENYKSDESEDKPGSDDLNEYHGDTDEEDIHDVGTTRKLIRGY